MYVPFHFCAMLALTDNLKTGLGCVYFSFSVLDHLHNNGEMYWRAVLVGFAH